MTEYTDPQKSPADGGFNADEKRVLLLTSPCHFLTHMYILIFPAVTIPIVNSLQMELADVLRLSFFMYLIYGIGALPAGYLSDRWQARKLLLFGVYLMGGGLLLAGFFPSPDTMPWALMIVGLGASIYHPAGLAMISRTVRRRGRALAINGIWGNMGIAAAPLFTGVLTWLYGWEITFRIFGASALVIGLLLGIIRVDETPMPEKKVEGASSDDSMRFFVILCVALVMGGIAYRGNTVILPAYLELKTTFFASAIASMSFFKTHGTATLAAAILTSIVMMLGIFGQLIGGRMADRWDLRYAYLIIQAAAVPFLLAMAFVDDVLLAVCAGLYVMFSLGMQPIENSLVAALTPSRWRSVAFAVKFILTFGVGAASVYLVGFVKTTWSLEAVYIFLTGIALLLVLSIIGLVVASRHVPRIRN